MTLSSEVPTRPHLIVECWTGVMVEYVCLSTMNNWRTKCPAVNALNAKKKTKDGESSSLRHSGPQRLKEY